jgi:hypothetical protein
LEAIAQPVDVMVKISARINTQGVAKGQPLEVVWKDRGRRHLGSIDNKRNDSDVPYKCLSHL